MKTPLTKEQRAEMQRDWTTYADWQMDMVFRKLLDSNALVDEALMMNETEVIQELQKALKHAEQERDLATAKLATALEAMSDIINLVGVNISGEHYEECCARVKRARSVIESPDERARDWFSGGIPDALGCIPDR